MKIIDGDSNETVERFPVTLIHGPTAFNHHNHIYNNILIFTVQHPEESQGKPMGLRARRVIMRYLPLIRHPD